MWFKTQHLGTDYIRIAMDVHRDQLFEVMQAVTGAADSAPERPTGAGQHETRAAQEGPGATSAGVVYVEVVPTLGFPSESLRSVAGDECDEFDESVELDKDDAVGALDRELRNALRDAEILAMTKRMTEPTDGAVSLEDVVELLREVVDRMGPKPLVVDFGAASRLGGWLRVSDEDACRSVDADEDDTELDCEGPGAEGVDGGEDR